MLIFLDFDGVLHPTGKDKNKEVFACIMPLWKILRSCSDVNVVFTTSWRDIYKLDEMVEFVTYGGGEDLASRFIGSTPNLEGGGYYGRRDLEIEQWLSDNNYSGQWLAIDDMPEIFNGDYTNLYVVDGRLGLTDADALEIMGKIK